MTSTRQRNAWIWLTVAALAVGTLARVEPHAPRTAAFANPVLEFLSAHTGNGAFAAIGLPAQPGHRNSLARAASSHAGAGAWMAMLPILFIGLVAPLSLVSPGSVLCLGRAPLSPALPCLFERPPPFRL